MKEPIPIFYACDDLFAKYAIVSIRSLLDHANPENRYEIHILNSGISEAYKQELLAMGTDFATVEFSDVTAPLETLRDRLPLRDYYTLSTYYRLFLPELFPSLNKALYIDSDTVILGDVAELYAHDLGDNYIGAVHDQIILQEHVFGDYAEQVLGVDRYQYFSAGILLMNCRAFREKDLLVKFVELLNQYHFVIAQDQDYLNVLCKDRVLWLSSAWNMQVFGELPCAPEDYKIVHYVMASKPWHYADCRLKEYFWEYVDKTNVAQAIRQELADYTEEQRARDAEGGRKLLQTARDEIARRDNYLRRVRRGQAPDRVRVLEKIDELERRGIFDLDVEDDPPAEELTADQIEYVNKTLWDKAKTKTAFFAAGLFVRKLMRDRQLIIKEIRGIERFRNLQTGAVITCNHFNAFDSFAIQLAYQASGQTDRKFYRVIREGNYTGFPGFYGFLMRNCDTLPLSSNLRTMAKFLRGTGELLREGNFVLFYPEQSMWWNYRKPKPLKDGAFTVAAKNGVPVLPCFITMRDSDILGPDGFYVQEYTIHIGEPIFPDPKGNYRANSRRMRDENAAQWKKIYEETYGMPLRYLTENSDALAKAE